MSRNGAARRNSPATTATTRVWRPRRSLVDWDAHKQPSRAISTIRQAIRHARSRRATGECVAAAGRPPRRGTARATPTRIAAAAIPARLRRNGPGNGFARRCALGERATVLRRPRTTGRAPTPADTAARRSNDYKRENGPRRPVSSICTGAGRRPSRTPSAAPERSGINADDIRARTGEHAVSSSGCAHGAISPVTSRNPNLRVAAHLASVTDVRAKARGEMTRTQQWSFGRDHARARANGNSVSVVHYIEVSALHHPQ